MTSSSWLWRNTERDADSGIDVGVRHILVLDMFHLLPTCHLAPYDIYYVIWIDADWAVFSLYNLQRKILRILYEGTDYQLKYTGSIRVRYCRKLFAGPCYCIEWSSWVVLQVNVPEEEKHDGVLLFEGSPDGSDEVDAKLFRPSGYWADRGGLVIEVFVVVFQFGCIASLGYSLTHPCSVTCLLAALLVWLFWCRSWYIGRMSWSVANSERSGAVDGGIVSAHIWTICHERLSIWLGDLCCQNGQVWRWLEWSLTGSWYLVTGGSISAPPEHVLWHRGWHGSIWEFRYMCVDDRRDWHALGESWKSIFQ